MIYAENTSSRLQYICRFIFTEYLGINFTLTTHLDSYRTHDGPTLFYNNQENSGEGIQIIPAGLLFEKGINAQDIAVSNGSEYPMLYFTGKGDTGFDILAASFFLVSRYEEYLPHEMDIHGRFAYTASTAYQQGFLHLPLVNIWLNSFAKLLKEKYPTLNIREREFSFLPTYDIDIAYSHRNKGLLRTIGGFVRNPSLGRIKTLLHLRQDEYASYDYLDDIHSKNKLKPVYFFLAGTKNNDYDKNISPYAHGMWQLMKKTAQKYDVGIHPSWRSFGEEKIVAEEKKIIETATDTPVIASRQHYLKFSLPSTFSILLKTGITEEFSMGYGTVNGFRASFGNAYYWYNLEEEKMTTLRIHPFCFMDATAFYQLKMSAGETFEEMKKYLETCRKNNCEMITIFHNQFLGTEKRFAGWREAYESFIARAVPDASSLPGSQNN